MLFSVVTDRCHGWGENMGRMTCSCWPWGCTHTVGTVVTLSSSSTRTTGGSRSNSQTRETRGLTNVRFPHTHRKLYRYICTSTVSNLVKKQYSNLFFRYCALCIVAIIRIAYISEAIGNYNKCLRLSNPNSQKLKKFYAITIHLNSLMMFIYVTILFYMFWS